MSAVTIDTSDIPKCAALASPYGTASSDLGSEERLQQGTLALEVVIVATLILVGFLRNIPVLSSLMLPAVIQPFELVFFAPFVFFVDA